MATGRKQYREVVLRHDNINAFHHETRFPICASCSSCHDPAGFVPLFGISKVNGVPDLILINVSRRRTGPCLQRRIMELRMPLARYFSFVGGVLLALLFILDACFPKLPVITKAKANLPVIRIYSDRKWPERIVYDTRLPTIVPTSMASTEDIIEAPKGIVDASAGSKERESFAMAPPQTSNIKMRELTPRHQRKIARKRTVAPPVATARHLHYGWVGGNFW